MIVDVHVHTSNRQMLGLHTTDASIDAIERSAQKYGIAKALVIATYFPFKKSPGVPNREMLRRIEGRERFAMIGSLDIMNKFEEGLRELEELAEANQLVAIKLYAGYQTFRVSDPAIFGVYRLARKYHLPVTIHGGDLHHCCRAWRTGNLSDFKCGNTFCWIEQNKELAFPREFEEAIRLFPDISFNIAHLGNPHFDQLRSIMRQYPNVTTDISGTIDDLTEDAPVLVRELHKIFELDHGIDRVMFASDFPIQSFEDTIQLVEMLGLDQVAKEKILWQNANRVYRLGLETRGVK